MIRRLLLVVGAATGLAAAGPIDPLWEDVQTLEQAQHQQQQQQPAPVTAAQGTIRVPLGRRSPRDVISAILSRPATTP